MLVSVEQVLEVAEKVRHFHRPHRQLILIRQTVGALLDSCIYSSVSIKHQALVQKGISSIEFSNVNGSLSLGVSLEFKANCVDIFIEGFEFVVDSAENLDCEVLKGCQIVLSKHQRHSLVELFSNSLSLLIVVTLLPEHQVVHELEGLFEDRASHLKPSVKEQPAIGMHFKLLVGLGWLSESVLGRSIEVDSVSGGLTVSIGGDVFFRGLCLDSHSNDQKKQGSGLNRHFL